MNGALAATVILAIVASPAIAGVVWYRIGKRDGIRQERARQLRARRYASSDKNKNVY
jgi:hypothetical protein